MAEERGGIAERSGTRPPYGRWEELEGGGVALIGSRCTGCAEVLFPERIVCPACRGEALEEYRLEGPATLHSFTVVHQLPSGFTAPLVVGYGRFPEKVLVLAPIDGDPAQLSPGLPLALHAGVTKTDESGRPVVTYRYRPAAGREEGNRA